MASSEALTVEITKLIKDAFIRILHPKDVSEMEISIWLPSLRRMSSPVGVKDFTF